MTAIFLNSFLPAMFFGQLSTVMPFVSTVVGRVALGVVTTESAALGRKKVIIHKLSLPSFLPFYIDSPIVCSWFLLTLDNQKTHHSKCCFLLPCLHRKVHRSKLFYVIILYVCLLYIIIYNYCIYDVTLPFCTHPDCYGIHFLLSLNNHQMCHSNQLRFYVGYRHYRKVHTSENGIFQQRHGKQRRVTNAFANSLVIISWTHKFFIRRVNNTWGRWNCL